MVWVLVACRSPDEGVIRRAPLSGPAAFAPSTPGEGPADPTDPTDPTVPTSPTSPTGLLGYIGSPCGTDADCPYEGGVCLREEDGFPLGTCSAPCVDFCEDAPGFPTTFCAASDVLPPDVSFLGDGGCLSRCDFGIYPGVGCREDYGCVEAPRASDASVETWVCLPEVDSELTPCLQDLADRGAPFSPTILADASPADAPDEVCHVEEPIVFQPGYLGVDLVYADTVPAAVSGACSLGQALADSIEDVVGDGVTTLHHLGTYNCRVIAGTSTLSRHAYGDAIDLSGFELGDGTLYSVQGDWEIDDATPESPGGAWLYGTANRWHDDQLWSIILTPDYNAAHYDHFHVDLTPGSDFLGFTGGWTGPAPLPDE